MTKPRVLVLQAPGTNCDLETEHAFQMAGAETCKLHINQLIDRPIVARSCQILCLPGGFSYGDDIAAGRILASKLTNHLREIVELYREEDRLMLGICNGFQVMMRMGIFFDDDPAKPPATLTWNRQGRFEDRWVHLKICDTPCKFLKGCETLYLPMAHAEGRFVFRNEMAKQTLTDRCQIAVQYADENGNSEDTLSFPDNPNGAEMNVAGICDSTGRIFGLMPHPERHLFPYHHPRWTRRETQPDHGDGLAIFKNAVDYFA